MASNCGPKGPSSRLTTLYAFLPAPEIMPSPTSPQFTAPTMIRTSEAQSR